MENQRPTKLDKTVKISIMAGVLIVALSVSYYFVYFLPKKEIIRSEIDKNKENTRKECANWASQEKTCPTDEGKSRENCLKILFDRCLREKGMNS